jgi:hypothetical protein
MLLVSAMLGLMEEEKKTSEEKSTAKGKKFPTWLIIVIVVVVVVLGGMYYAANLVRTKIADKLPVRIDTKNSTYKVKTGNMDTVVSDKAVPWPAEIPQDLPKYQGGKIKAVSHEKSTDTWVVTVGETTAQEFNNYKTYLTNANWEAGDSIDTLVNMVQFKKGDRQVSLVFDPSSNGVLISLTQVKQ